MIAHAVVVTVTHVHVPCRLQPLTLWYPVF